jgi:TatD DNase family protein
MALEYIKLGFYISLGGPVTFKNAKEPKRVAANIPLDKLLVETDCPFLAPEPFRGKRNESSYVKYSAEAIANIRGISYEELTDATYKNSLKIFNIGKD